MVDYSRVDDIFLQSILSATFAISTCSTLWSNSESNHSHEVDEHADVDPEVVGQE